MFAKAIRYFIFLILALVFSTQFKAEHKWLLFLQLVFTSLGFLIFYVKKPQFLLGLAIPTLTFFPYGTLSSFILCLNIGIKPKSKTSDSDLKTSHLLFKLLLLPLFFSLLVCFYFEFDYYIFKTLVLNAGILESYFYFKETNPPWLRALFNFCIWVNFLILFYKIKKISFKEEVLENKDFINALSIGVIFSCVIGFFQVLDLHSYFSINREVFWLHVKRFEGTFTDPNALGVMAALLVPYFYYSKSKLAYLASAILFVFAIFSESRTFWLAMMSWFLIVNIKKPKYYIAFILPLILFIPSVNNLIQSIPLFSRFKRILTTLNFNTLYESLYSRLLMGEIAINMFKQNVLLGVGLDRFFVKQAEVAKSSGLDIGDWKDNANNLYLQVASEQGIFGLAVLVLLFCFLFLNRKKELGQSSLEQGNLKLSNLILGITAIIFITGPHIYFEEVRYFLAIVLASHITSDIKNSYIYFAFAIGSLLLLSLPKKSLQGFWGIENSSEGKFLWTSSKASLSICNDKIPLQLRTFNIPMSVDIFLGNKHRKIDLVDTKWKSIDIKDENTKNILLLPSNVWSPQGDSRWLGVMLKSNFQACES